ncbi:efflux RND transporter periplasmic adaptor subunit [Aquirhabdus sp.]|uniref:efflux RND transporter periplasmic adaptor subunit n=1 Tax=Aquirhabdus sp. TaxID=2824160 RepID=UPI00396CE4C0
MTISQQLKSLMTALKSKFSSRQLLILAIVIGVTVLLALWLLRKPALPAPEATEVATTAKPVATTKAEHDEIETIALSDEQIASIGLQIATVDSAKLSTQLDLPGELKLDTDQESHISSPLAGRVESVHVATGQYVKKGQSLATLLVPQLVELQGSFKAANSRLALAKTNYDRELTLWKQGISAKQDYLQAENSWQQANIEVAAAREGLQAYGASATGQTGRLTLTASTNGTLVAKDLTVGETVQSSNQLFTIAKLDALWVEFAVPPTLAGQLSPNMALEVMTNTDQPPMSARLLTYTPSADSKTRNLIARARLVVSERNLRPSQLVTVRMKGEAQVTPIVIDSRAIQTIKDKTVVFIESKTNGKTSFKAQPVTVGTLSDGHLIAVTQGLNKGERYVTSGSFTLKSEVVKSEAEHE